MSFSFTSALNTHAEHLVGQLQTSMRPMRAHCYHTSMQEVLYITFADLCASYRRLGDTESLVSASSLLIQHLQRASHFQHETSMCVHNAYIAPTPSTFVLLFCSHTFEDLCSKTPFLGSTSSRKSGPRTRRQPPSAFIEVHADDDVAYACH